MVVTSSPQCSGGSSTLRPVRLSWCSQHHLEDNSAITGRIIRLATDFSGQQPIRTPILRRCFHLLHRNTVVPLWRLF